MVLYEEKPAPPEPKVIRARKLLEEQQQRLNAQRELVAQLESKETDAPALRSARETLRQIIRAYEAMLREFQQVAANRRVLESGSSESLPR